MHGTKNWSRVSRSQKLTNRYVKSGDPNDRDFPYKMANLSGETKTLRRKSNELEKLYEKDVDWLRLECI